MYAINLLLRKKDSIIAAQLPPHPTHALTSTANDFHRRCGNYEIKAWMSNYIALFYDEAIVYPCPNLDAGLVNLLVKRALGLYWSIMNDNM